MDVLFNEIINAIGGVKFCIERHPDLIDEPGCIEPNLDYDDIQKDLKAHYGDNVGLYLADLIDENSADFEQFIVDNFC